MVVLGKIEIDGLHVVDRLGVSACVPNCSGTGKLEVGDRVVPRSEGLHDVPALPVMHRK